MLLGLDLGTTNVKALLVAPRGRVVARGSAPVSLVHVGEAGVEQDIEEIWEATLTAVREAGEQADLGAVEAVGVSAQGGAMQVLDGGDGPLGPVISWLDGRARRWAAALTDELGEDWFAGRIGHRGAGLAVAQILRLRAEHPEVLAPAHQVGFVGDVIVGRLCGRRAHDGTSLSLCLLYNPGLRRADPDLLDRLDLDEERLPDLLPAHEPAGRLLPEVAQQTGLPTGVPVSPAVHDQYAAALGCGAVRAGDIMIGAGTAWVLLAVLARLAPPIIPSAFVCTHVVEGLYGQILSLVNGGSAFDWALRTLGLAGLLPEQIDALLKEAPPGADGVRFRPLLVPGGGAGLAPGTAGRFDGLRLRHERRHLLRAVEEGLICELARYLGLLTDAGGDVDRLILTGGAAGSGVAAQILADVAGLAVHRVAEPDTSAFGAAVLACGLTESDADLAELSLEMAPERRHTTPGPNAGVYRALLREYLDGLPTLRESEV